MSKNQKSAISETVYESIKNKITTMQLRMGQPLQEEMLADEFHVSRTPVREALKRLEQDGLVTIKPYQGSVVREITESDLREIYTIRQALEGLCSQNAAEVISEANILKLENEWQKASNAIKKKNYNDANLCGDLIHTIIVQIGGGKRMNQIIDNLHAQTKQLSYMSVQLPGRMEKSNEEHRQIIDAIKERNGKLASECMQAHISGTCKDMISALKNSYLF